MTCIITQNDLTESEDFTEAAIVLSSLETRMAKRLTCRREPFRGARPAGMFTVETSTRSASSRRHVAATEAIDEEQS